MWRRTADGPRVSAKIAIGNPPAASRSAVRDRGIVEAMPPLWRGRAAMPSAGFRAMGGAMTDAQSTLIDAARQSLGAKAVITDPADVGPWLSDWRGRVHGRSPAILAPASTAE